MIRKRRMRQLAHPVCGRRRLARAGVLLAATLAVAGLVWSARVPCDRSALDFSSVASVRVTARDGSALRLTRGAGETRAEWVPLARISPRLVQATLAAEDRRFRAHPGIDPTALARALWMDARARRLVAGGSTITQQLAGLLWPEPRTLRGKLREAVRAVRLEMDLSKDEILEQYLNRLPYGTGMQGVAAASRAYFGRPPDMLGASQAATLAALPKAPSKYARPEARRLTQQRRDRILAAMHRHRNLSAAELTEARRRDLELDYEPPPFVAPHFADWVLQQRTPAQRRAVRLETTLDPGLQREVEGIVAAALPEMRPEGVRELAVVVQAIDTGEILAMVGSPAWGDARAGQVNGALAPRQPGSVLKPFLYALAFEDGMSPADLLADVPFRALDDAGGEDAPRNYDGRFHGPVRAREALASSFNVPAVRLQERLGTERVLALLQRAGLATLDAPAEHYGLGLTLGVGEVTLLDLTNAYAGLARGGIWMPAVALRSARDLHGRELPSPRIESRRWIAPEAAFLVLDILADDRARIPGFGPSSVLDLPFPVAVKTGTSTDYRNSWCLGCTRDHVIGVWAGNFDATPIRGLAGVHCAGPVFRSVALRLRERGSRPWSTAPPPGWTRRPVCALSGGIPTGACRATILEWLAPGTAAPGRPAQRPPCAFHDIVQGQVVVRWPPEYQEWARALDEVRAASAAACISTPLDGSIYYLDPRLQPSAGIRFAAAAPHPDDVWVLDGRALHGASHDGSLLWSPRPGEHVLQLVRGSNHDLVRFGVR